MANVKTEYFEEYCSGKKKKHVNDSHDFVMCSSDITRQPVGGRVADARRQLQADSAPPPRLPACDEDYVATIYAGTEHATHRVEPSYKDPRWNDAMRAENHAGMYEPAQRDPPNRGNWYVYRSTLPDPRCTPCKPLTVPDVHKLRYMANNYMTADDWY